MAEKGEGKKKAQAAFSDLGFLLEVIETLTSVIVSKRDLTKDADIPLQNDQVNNINKKRTDNRHDHKGLW